MLLFVLVIFLASCTQVHVDCAQSTTCTATASPSTMGTATVPLSPTIPQGFAKAKMQEPDTIYYAKPVYTAATRRPAPAAGRNEALLQACDIAAVIRLANHSPFPYACKSALPQRMAGISRAKTKNGKDIGRPRAITPEIADLICEKIANGGLLSKICEAPDMPCRETVYASMVYDEAFSNAYARACLSRTDVWADEIVSISEASETATSPVAVNSARLRVDTRKWLMARLHPSKYGDKLELAGNKDAPLTIVVTRYGDGPETLPAPIVIDVKPEPESDG